MGRVVRRVAKDWMHPVYTRENAPYPSMVGRHVALFDGFDPDEQAEWDEGARKWADGLRPEKGEWIPLEEAPLQYRGKDDTWEEWTGKRPDPADYMPSWSEEELTHIMMYETTTEGTPISPAFETGRELARWLADNDASCFGHNTASYETWLGWIREDGIVDPEEHAEDEADKPIWSV